MTLMALEGISLEVGSADIHSLVKVLVCTLPLLLPDGYEAASPVYRIEQKQQDVYANIQHYAKESSDLKFLMASLTAEKRENSPVYEFKEISGSTMHSLDFNKSHQIGRVVDQPGYLLVASKRGTFGV